MANAITYEYLNSIKGINNGIATLDGNGKLNQSQLPAGAVETFKGEFATAVALTTAFPTANLADYAYVTATLSFWFWNRGLVTPTWANQEISITVYLALSQNAKVAMPYLITA